MTKAEIIEQIVAKTGIEKPTVAAVVEEIMLKPAKEFAGAVKRKVKVK